jgi:hypothetical protein
MSLSIDLMGIRYSDPDREERVVANFATPREFSVV